MNVMNFYTIIEKKTLTFSDKNEIYRRKLFQLAQCATQNATLDHNYSKFTVQNIKKHIILATKDQKHRQQLQKKQLNCIYCLF